jgi:chromosome segregation ATPase
MSATNGEALVSAINRLLVRLDAQGVSANEIVACIKPLIADSEAAAVQIAMLREYGNLCATNEGLAKERDQLRAEVELGEQLQAATEASLKTVTTERDQLRAEIARLDSEKPWLKEANATNAELRAEVERLKFYIATTIQPDEYAKVIKDLRAEVERLNDQLAKAVWDTDVNRANARADKAEAELAAERARLDDLVADLNDACITLASAKDDCDDYALLNTGFKLTAVREVLLQYIPPAAMKEGAK